MNVPSRSWFALLLICSAVFCAFVAVFAIPPLMGMLTHRFQISYARAGLFMTAYTMIPTFGSLLIGFYSDRIGVRRAVLNGLALLAAAGFLSSLTQNFWQMLACRILIGVGATSVFVPGLATVLHLLPRARVNLATGAFFSSLNLGLSVAMLATPILAKSLGWRVPLSLFGALALVLSAIILSFTNKDFFRRSGTATSESTRAPARENPRMGARTGECRQFPSVLSVLCHDHVASGISFATAPIPVGPSGSNLDVAWTRGHSWICAGRLAGRSCWSLARGSLGRRLVCNLPNRAGSGSSAHSVRSLVCHRPAFTWDQSADHPANQRAGQAGRSGTRWKSGWPDSHHRLQWSNCFDLFGWIPVDRQRQLPVDFFHVLAFHVVDAGAHGFSARDLFPSGDTGGFAGRQSGITVCLCKQLMYYMRLKC